MDAKIFEHNNWANRQLIEACSALSDEQLDSPQRGSDWTIRVTLMHLVNWQRDYLYFFTPPPDKGKRGPLPFADLQASATASGESSCSSLSAEQASMSWEVRFKRRRIED